MNWKTIIDQLVESTEKLHFAEPVTHVYNPLVYARKAHDQYLKRYGQGKKKIVLLGMNPGPWGMAQNGVPFGEMNLVRNWLGIEAPVDKPPQENPKRPIEGFACQRSEVSGRRLWGWAQETFGTPENFFSSFFVANYCPLVFMEASGKNRTPNVLPVAEREPLMLACDTAVRQVVDLLQPEWVIGVGQYAQQRAESALKDFDVKTGRITHPSPANPKANKGWAPLITQEFEEMGVALAAA